METELLAAIPGADRIINIATVALGLGLVIFFHELGHFAVAKWCGVMVERFSIGFGPILWRRKWGETEYALSAIPFGGYVKMLGQDDSDPGQMTDEQIAADPRSYTSKSVLQRMAIISAGVTMNVITGLLFFVLAFRSGVRVSDNEIGFVRVGMPAWEHGIRDGDKITSMNGRPVEDFSDILRQTALSRGDIVIVGRHADGATFEETISPLPPEDKRRVHRMIGVGPQTSLRVPAVKDPENDPIARKGSPAAAAGFKPKDQVVAAAGVKLNNYRDFERVLAEHRSETVPVVVQRVEPATGKASEVTVNVAPQPFRTLGLRMPIGDVTAVRRDSPAARATPEPIQKRDVITHVDGREVGGDLDPLQLPDYFSSHAGQTVTIRIKRDQPGGEPKVLEVTTIPDDRLAWSEPPLEEGSPLSIPSLGIAYKVLPNIYSIEANGPAAKLDLKPGDEIVSLTLPPASGAPKDSKPTTYKITDAGWPFAFWSLQERSAPTEVTLTIKSPGSNDEKPSVTVQLADSTEFRSSPRGLWLEPLTVERKASTVGDALAMGWTHTCNSVTDIYLTLRNLILRDLSIKSLSGPLGIAMAASQFAEQGFADFLLFLGLISINLAVINFLPIPVLDGGHMVFLLWEGIARRKPSERVVVTATYMGFAFVVGLMITVIYIDLFVVKK